MIKSYALVKDGTIKNIISLKEGTFYPTDCEMVEVPDDHTFEPNFVYDEVKATFVSPIPVDPELEQKGIELIAKNYLASTDWYITRFMETGVPVPLEITAARAEARAKIA